MWALDEHATHDARRAPSQRVTLAHPPTPWTATRCHRLLRPLLTHLSALRREVALISNAHSERSSSSSHLNSDGKRPRTRSSSANAGKKIRYTYSTRGSRRSNTPSSREISLSKTQDRPCRQLSQPAADGASTTSQPGKGAACTHPPCPAKSCALEIDLRKLRHKIPVGEYNLYDSVFRAVESLLRATTPQETRTPETATKSLLGMCLRKVPGYIAELEAWEQKEAEERRAKTVIDDSHTSFSVYSDLEALGAVEAGGWKHLRMLARAHCMHHLSLATSEGLLNVEFAEILLALCGSHRLSFHELDGFAQNLIERRLTHPQETRFDRRGSYSIDAVIPSLTANFGRSAARSFMYRGLSRLLMEKRLSAEWILPPRVNDIWSEMLAGVADGKDDNQTADLMIAVLSSLGNFIPSSASRTSSHTSSLADLSRSPDAFCDSALPLLASLVSVLKNNLGEEPKPPPPMKTRKLVMYVLESCLRLSKSRRKGLGQHIRYLLALAGLLASWLWTRHGQSTDIDVEKEEEQCGSDWEAMVIAAWQHARVGDQAFQEQQYNVTKKLICEVAALGGHDMSQQSPMDQLMAFCEQLEMLSLPESPLANLRADSALYLAGMTGSHHDFAFAEQIARESGKKADLAGYRWDDGIGEWVSKTPAAKPKHEPILVSSPCRPPPRRRNLRPRVSSRRSTDDFDELSFLEPEPENEHHTRGAEKNATKVHDEQRQPLRVVSNQYGDVSDDELGF